MSLAEAQRKSFENRLGKIRAQASNTMGEVHIGPAEARASEGKPTNRVRIKSTKDTKTVMLGQGSNKVLVPVGFILGGLSIFGGMALNFHLFDPRGLLQLQNPVPALEPYLIYAPFVFASVFALALSWTFRLSNFLRRSALICGVLAGFVYHAQLVDFFPGTHVTFFNKAYVKDVRGSLR
jgi:hypothetical protein